MQRSTQTGLEGHPRGGPLVLGALALLLALGACGGRSAQPGGAPAPGRTELLSRPLEIYNQMGLMAGPAHFPVVASLATVAGPADSTYVIVSMSMPNSALRFQREGSGFIAQYTVSALFVQDSVEQGRLEGRETVRVGVFAETGRTDESVVYQQAVALRPGRYEVRLQANDANSSRGFRKTDTLDVPAYGANAARISAPLLVYEADGRTDRSVLPSLIANPRHAVPYGGDSPRIYIESYGLGAQQPLDVRVLNEAGTSVWNSTATLTQGDSAMRYGVVELPSATLPLGRFWVEVAEAGAAPHRTPIVLTISDQWMVANFDEVLDFIRFIAYPAELDSLRSGSPAERRERWEAFWKRRDPLPVTEVNEYRDEFFQRVRYATEVFREPGGRAGWDTDRGEVYIVMGPPDQAVERYISGSNMTAQPNAEEWYYSNVPGGRLSLLFVDRNNFGRFELTPSSEAAFRSAAEQMKPRR